MVIAIPTPSSLVNLVKFSFVILFLTSLTAISFWVYNGLYPSKSKEEVYIHEDVNDPNIIVDGVRYGVPFTWGCAPMMYNTKVILAYLINMSSNFVELPVFLEASYADNFITKYLIFNNPSKF